MAERGYTIPIAGRESRDRATIWRDADGWYYCLRTADPHGEEFAGDPVGPFSSADEAEHRAQRDFLPQQEE